MAERVLHLDFETRSRADLKKVGLHRYAEDPSTEVLVLSWRFDEGGVTRWTRGDSASKLDPLVSHIFSGGRVVAHNAAFERTIFNTVLPRQLGVDSYWPELQIEQQDCTMARGLAMGLPASLDQLGGAMKTRIQKDKEGHALMLRMCKPKPKTGGWHETPEELQRLAVYCDQDVLTECSIDANLPALSPAERKVWELDQRINDRGVMLDLHAVHRLQELAEEAKAAADREMWRLTEGAIRTCGQAKAIVAWLCARGIPCESVADGETEELITASELFDDEIAEKVIRLRRASSKAFKFPAMLASVCGDGRVRGSLAYHGAHTGRWAGRGIQPQNMKRISDEEEERWVQVALDTMHRADALDVIEMMAGPPLEVLSLCARPMIVAPRGKKLVGGDFSNIEGRLAAWFAGARWKLDAFRAYDAGTGPDLYKVTASQVLQKPLEDITKRDRQESGKVPELACGYQGSVRAFQKMGAKSGVRVSDTHALTTVKGWRALNTEIVQCWWDLQDAAIEAVSNPGVQVPVLRNKVRYLSTGAYLFCRLPSGRVIPYASPSVAWKSRVITVDGEEVEVNKRTVSYWGLDQKRWTKIDLYGGMQFNHIVQGTARDVMVEAMMRVEAEDYPLVLTVHDELLAEVAESFGSADEFEQLMAVLPAWAEGLPLAVQAWEGPRYVK
jgi:DNA polymerase